MSPGDVLESSGSVGLSLVMWTICGLICCMGALCALELGLLYPASGGSYVYIHYGLGDLCSDFIYEFGIEMSIFYVRKI